MALNLSDRLTNLDADFLRETPNRLLQQTRTRVQSVRHDLYTRRETGRVRLWSLSADALEKAQEALAQAPDQLSPVTERIDKALTDGIEQVTRLPIADYDGLNVRKISDAVRALDLVELERVARYERANKDRVTVARAIDREREKRLAAPKQQG